MEKPIKPELKGVHRSKDNRFEFNFDLNPSPMRAKDGKLSHLTEHLPVICSWCGNPFWPDKSVTRGRCSDKCTEDEKVYRLEMSEREKLMEELERREVDNAALRGLLGKSSVT